MVILKGIPSILTPELLYVLAQMGHGDELGKSLMRSDHMQRPFYERQAKPKLLDHTLLNEYKDDIPACTIIACPWFI